MSDQEECNCPPPGLPAWMGTFADLMSLLMCFFVLLLSFSEMDVLKFKQIAGSMNFAFGVQNKVNVKDIPKGTSIIAQEFSPGKPNPTLIEVIMQETMEIEQDTLEFDEPDDDNDGEGEGKNPEQGLGVASQQGADQGESLAEKDNMYDNTEPGSDASAAEIEKQKQAEKEAEMLAQSIAQDLQKEIIDGQIELLAKGAFVVIRVREKGSFSSGSDGIEAKFLPVIKKIETILTGIKGEIRVAGHTDNLPIDNEYFKSNWELSGARAGSVTRELLKSKKLDKNRFVITGYAETKPIADNNTAEGRAANRRVEIIIVKGKMPLGDVVSVGIKDQVSETDNSNDSTQPEPVENEN